MQIEYARDEWSGFADLLAGLIEKYINVLEIDESPISSENAAICKIDIETEEAV